MSRNYRTRKGNKPKSRKLAALLALVGGSVGVHKFYLNQPGQGIMFIFLFTIAANLSFPLTAVLGIFDAFRLFTMSDEQFHHKYNRGAYVNPTHRDSKVERRRQRQMSRPERTVRGSKPTRAAVQRANPFKKSGIAKYKDVELGFTDFDLISTKDDLAFVRIQPEWDAFKENGFQLKRGMMSSAAANANPNQTDDVLLSQLNKLSELRKKGLLSEDESPLARSETLVLY